MRTEVQLHVMEACTSLCRKDSTGDGHLPNCDQLRAKFHPSAYDVDV